MIDRDLAKLYGIETRVLNQAVRRNRERFPVDFMLVFTRVEIRDLSQIVISHGLKNAPNMRMFGLLREMIFTHKELAKKKLEDLEQKYDSQFKMVFDAMRQLLAPPDPKKKRAIGFGRD